jgi:hypothetical protein
VRNCDIHRNSFPRTPFPHFSNGTSVIPKSYNTISRVKSTLNNKIVYLI